jgi:hypothetical protein
VRCCPNPIDVALTENHKLPVEHETASRELRALACELFALVENIYAFHLFLPSKGILNEAGKALMGLSNSMTLPYGSGSASTFEWDRIDARTEALKKNLRFFKYSKKKGHD